MHGLCEEMVKFSFGGEGLGVGMSGIFFLEWEGGIGGHHDV